MSKHYIIPIFVPHAGCPHLCVFCNQKRISGQVTMPTPEQVTETITTYLATMPPMGEREVAFYGGSFTALPLKVQQALLQPAAAIKAQGKINGIRLSTRPDAISLPVLKLLSDFGVDTVELGVQSMVTAVLQASRRGHTSEDVVQATALLRQNGFSVGHQIMPGLPGDNVESALLTGQLVAKLKPDFVRIYPTLVITNTQLEEQWQQGCYEPWSLEQAIVVAARLLLLFEHEQIKVIRVGLQPSEDLRHSGTVLAGPFHSAFGELVENQIALWQMQTLLGYPKQALEEQNIELYVHPKNLSKFIGQKKANRTYVQNDYKLASFRILADDSLAEDRCYWKFAHSPSKAGENRRGDLNQSALPSY